MADVEYKVDNCSRCNRQIIWTTTPTGARMPLDARAVVLYSVEGGRDRPQAVPMKPAAVKQGAVDLFMLMDPGPAAEPTPVKVYVSHFVTCPNAAEHSKARK